MNEVAKYTLFIVNLHLHKNKVLTDNSLNS